MIAYFSLGAVGYLPYLFTYGSRISILGSVAIYMLAGWAGIFLSVAILGHPKEDALNGEEKVSGPFN